MKCLAIFNAVSYGLQKLGRATYQSSDQTLLGDSLSSKSYKLLILNRETNLDSRKVAKAFPINIILTLSVV
jgi:hypothetical protein